MATQSEMQVDRLNTSEILSIQSREFNNRTYDTIDAKKLHAFLEVGRDFSNWIKARIKQYDFVEGQDYILTNAKTGVRSNVKEINYFITLDMAKELAMVERNEKGKEARRYFIECEHQLRNNQAPAIEHTDTAHEALSSPEDNVTLAEQAKYKMLNGMVKSMEFKEDSIVVPTIELVRMVHAIRTYQRRLALIAKNTQSPDWINEQLDIMKVYTNSTLAD